MILVCTLGTSWQVIPEAYALLAPARYPLYRHQPKDLGLAEPSAVWVVTTARTNADQVEQWWDALGRPVPLQWFRISATDGQAQNEIELLRELIFRVVLQAGPDAVLCLSGGRKTMSADMQRAGMVFGCRAMVHVLPPEITNDKGHEVVNPRLNTHDWTMPLPADLPVRVVEIGRGQRSDVLAIAPAISSPKFPIASGIFPGPADEGWLWRALDERERDGGRVLSSYHAAIARNEKHENWRSLYRLPPATIDVLRATCVSDHDLEWLTRLPKAELHCHIGGVLDLDEQRMVGAAVRLAGGGDEAAQVAARELADPRDQLEARLWGPSAPRVGLTARLGFDAFEEPGILTGSTVLRHPAAIAPYAAAVRARCHRDGIRYLELRGSPHKYAPGFLQRFREALGPDDERSIIRFLWIIDRREPDGKRIRAILHEAVRAREKHDGFVIGLDVAGDEQKGEPRELAPYLEEAFAACLSVTIHAGEGQQAQRIWEAAYLLHADRIGHGLSLAEPEATALARRFRDRRICLELCPTSNIEVVGFRDPGNPDTIGYPDYPLRRLLDQGQAVTLCTDNPGISRTTLAQEYLAAGRMAQITRWEALLLIKQGFLHAFLPADERERLLKVVDQRIFEIIQRETT